MSHPESSPAVPYEPPRPALLAALVFLVAALTLCWPMLAGRFLLGDDQYVAGYAFRLFGAEMFHATGRIPEWNPYLFGGLPYIAAQHGDISEETTRLTVHLEAMRALLNRNGAVGKSIEFLLQEINREVNTMGAKSQNAHMSQVTVAMKGEVEKMREQVQNVE